MASELEVWELVAWGQEALEVLVVAWEPVDWEVSSLEVCLLLSFTGTSFKTFLAHAHKEDLELEPSSKCRVLSSSLR